MVNHFGLEEGGWSWRTERRNKRAESCCRAGWGEGSRQPCRGVAEWTSPAHRHTRLGKGGWFPWTGEVVVFILVIDRTLRKAMGGWWENWWEDPRAQGQDPSEPSAGEGARSRASLDLTGKGDFPSLSHQLCHNVSDDFSSAEGDHHLLLLLFLGLHSSQQAGRCPALTPQP